jgi:hypothetical protein
VIDDCEVVKKAEFIRWEKLASFAVFCVFARTTFSGLVVLISRKDAKYRKAR